MTAQQTSERGNIETFLETNAPDIKPADRAKMREAAAKAISGATLNVSCCPDHLRDSFRQIVTEAAYIERVKGQKFNPKAEVMPTAGVPYRNQSRKCNL